MALRGAGWRHSIPARPPPSVMADNSKDGLGWQGTTMMTGMEQGGKASTTHCASGLPPTPWAGCLEVAVLAVQCWPRPPALALLPPQGPNKSRQGKGGGGEDMEVGRGGGEQWQRPTAGP